MMLGMTASAGPGDDSESARRAATAIGIIAQALDLLAASGEVALQPGTARLFRAACGWFAFIVRSGQAVVLLHDAGLRHECAASATAAASSRSTYAYLVDSSRCVIRAGHVMERLLASDDLREAVTRAEQAFGAPVDLWPRPVR